MVPADPYFPYKSLILISKSKTSYKGLILSKNVLEIVFFSLFFAQPKLH